jgi:hypothetical protein
VQFQHIAPSIELIRTVEIHGRLVRSIRGAAYTKRTVGDEDGESSDLEHEEASRVAADALEGEAGEARDAAPQRSAGRDGPQGGLPRVVDR